MRTITVFRGAGALALLVLVGYGAAACSKGASAFAELERHVDELMASNDYKGAVEALEAARRRFPEHEEEIQARLAAAYVHVCEGDQCLEAREAALERRRLLRMESQPAPFPPDETTGPFQTVVSHHTHWTTAAESAPRWRVNITAPAGDDRTPLPLLIVLEEGPSSAGRAERHWKTPHLNKGFFVAHVQTSSPGLSMSDGPLLASREASLRELYQEIVERYPVDPKKVVVGGAAAGGALAIDVSLKQVIPTTGFIGVCPSKPPKLDSLQVRIARERGLRGVLIAGERDRDLPLQKRMVELFRREYFPHELIVVPGLADDYPRDFARRVDRALDYILRVE